MPFSPKVFNARADAAKLLYEAGDLTMAQHILSSIMEETNKKPDPLCVLDGCDLSIVVSAFHTPADRSRKIEFIKEVRVASGAGLREAKDFVERFTDYK